MQDDYRAARTLQEESLALFREVGDKGGLAYSLFNLGQVAYAQDEYATAHDLHRESLALFRELGQQQGIAGSLEAFAALASVQEQTERAARLWGTAEALREEIGAPLQPRERKKHDREIAQARADLSEDGFNAAWSEGRAMTLEQAIAYALEEAA